MNEVPCNRQVTRSNKLLVRGGILLLALCGIKVWLLDTLAGHAYLTHWRLDGVVPGWVDYASCYLFILLVALSVVLVGKSFQVTERSAIRACSAAFVIAGLATAFLSFCRMQSNYLYPVMTGVLDWSDIWCYLKQDLFFERPYLAGYLLAYALIYWLLLRSRREHLIFPVLAIMATVYLALDLRHLLTISRELLAAECLALAGLAGWVLTRKPLPMAWQALPMAGVALAWLYFGMTDKTILRLPTYSVLILSLSVSLWALANVLARRTRGYPALSHFLPFYLAAFFMLANRGYPLADNLDHLAVYGLTLAHYFWQELAAATCVLLVALVVGRLRRGLSWVLFDALFFVLVLAGLVDGMLARTMGFRLDWYALISSNKFSVLWRTVQPFVGPLFGAIIVLAAVYYASIWFLNRRAKGARLTDWPATGARLAFPGLCALTLTIATPALLGKADKADGFWVTRVISSCPQVANWRVKKLSPQEFSEEARRLHLPAERGRAARLAAPNEAARELNVVLILMESSYNRYLSLFGASDETQPLLRKYRDRMEVFPNFYCNFINSLNARFAVVSGLYPCKPYVTYVNPRVESPSLFDLFHDRGYTVSLYDSSYRDYQRWNDYLRHRKIDSFYDADTMPGQTPADKVSWGLSESATMEAIRRELGEHAHKGERFFLTYMPVAPHMPYDCPAQRFAKFTQGAGHLTSDYTGRYKNQLLYMDWIIASMIEELEKLGLLDRTLVVITDDHGEMVGEDHGKLGHGWNLEPWLANVPLIIMDPARKGYRENFVLGSQVDILPTIADLMNLPLPSDALYQGVSLLDPEASRDKVIYIGSHRPRACIKGNRYFLEEPNGVSGRQGASVHAYEIAHEGVRTVFRVLDEKPDISTELDQFDAFQKSFIVHYPSYRAAVAQSRGNAPQVHARR